MKRYLIEFFGTFIVVLAVSLTENPFAMGPMYLAMLYLGARISGAHYNPAISLASWLRGTLSTERLPWYVLAQVLGALAAIGFEYKLSNSLYVPDVSPEDNVVFICLLEVLFTFVLAYVFLVVRTVPRVRDTQLYGIILGMTFAGLSFMGGLFNPAIGAGAFLLHFFGQAGEAAADAATVGMMHNILVYIVCPLVGGALGGLAFDYLEAPASGQFASVDSAE